MAPIVRTVIEQAWEPCEVRMVGQTVVLLDEGDMITD